MSETYRRVVLASRPAGMPGEENFRLEEAPRPEPGEGEVLVRVVYLSVDPYMRGRMRDVKSYAEPVQVDEVMVGGTVGEVVASRHPDYREGDLVEGRLGWQEYGLSDGRGLRKLDPALAPISTALGVLGMPGLTAYFGLLHVGQPRTGETVLVSGAAGAVGALVAQIARIHGCRAVGIAGGGRKCAYLTDELGIDTAVDYKAAGDLGRALAGACPDGVDVYFDNVGGPVTDAVMPLMNEFGRISVCGQISQYNHPTPEQGPRHGWLFISKRLRQQGFLVFDFARQYREGRKALAGWLKEGRLHYKEDVVQGLERAPQAFLGLFSGANLGKMLVQVGEVPPQARG